MNLVIDVGNSFVKLAVFEDNTLKSKTVIKPSRFISNLNRVKKRFPEIKRAIIASSGRLKKEQLSRLLNSYVVLELTSQTNVPFNNQYGTPKTLGTDRIALASSAVLNFTNRNALIIDAGTCITYDFIDKNSIYYGGAISPGIRMRYQALHDQTAKLPLVDTKMPDTIVGDTTASSIHSGVIYGVLKEIDGVIEEYTRKHPDLTVILTGGDAKLLSNKLKNSIFANSDFLLEGLNFILDYNS